MKRRRGERRAFRAAFPRDFARIWAALHRHQIPTQDRHDLAQDVLLAALEAWQKRRAEIAAPERWFNGVILNHVRRWRRRRFDEMARIDEEAQVEEVIDKSRNAEELLMSEERRRLIHQLYDEIPVDHLDALIAHAIDGLTFEEIAEAFEEPVSTVYGHYKAGMSELRAALERWKARHRDRGLLLLPLTVDALLDADRTTPELPSEEEEERAWRRYQQALGHGGPDDDAPTSAPRPMHIPRSIGWPALLPVLGSVFTGLVSGVPVRTAAAPLDITPAPVARVDSPAATAPSASASSAASAAADAPRPQAVPAASTDARHDRTAYMDEQTTFDKARAAFIQANMGAALKALAEHEQRYPRGVYGRERDRMWMEALVSLGRAAEACPRAERFRRAYPRSPLPAQLDKLCPVRPERMSTEARPDPQTQTETVVEPIGAEIWSRTP